MDNSITQPELDILRKLFPARFSELGFMCPPVDSMPMELLAYRLCKNESTKLKREDFLPSNIEGSSKMALTSVSAFSVSFFETQEPLEKFRTFSKHKNKCILRGKIRKKYGFSRRDSRGSCHVDLWLYEDAQPWVDFCDF